MEFPISEVITAITALVSYVLGLLTKKKNKMKKFITISEFVDIDTGEIINNLHRKEQLKYTNYVLVSTTKKNEENEKTKTIKITNLVRHTGQRELHFIE